MTLGTRIQIYLSHCTPSLCGAVVYNTLHLTLEHGACRSGLGGAPSTEHRLTQRAVGRSLVHKLVDIEVVGVWWDTVKLSHRRFSSGARFKGQLAWVRGGNPLNIGEKDCGTFS